MASMMRLARETAGISQSQVAEICGVSRQAVAKWESVDPETIPPRRLYRLVRLYGLQLGDVIRLDPLDVTGGDT